MFLGVPRIREIELNIDALVKGGCGNTEQKQPCAEGMDKKPMMRKSGHEELSPKEDGVQKEQWYKTMAET
jgi:hypothetical protein